MNMLSSIFRDNRFRPEDVPKFEGKLFYEGDRRRPYLERFFVLLILATIIATAGIIGDSTATVIGAMIVAPLMTPIMATAAALIMGNMSRAVNRLSLVLIGVLTVVFLSWLAGLLYPSIISFTGNSQIVARVSPRLIDLLAALASGAAGAFCLSRDDVADSLPGVAIAISLVPPLCVVGLSLSAGELEAALGALLLFVTNFLAILLAGGAVLGILGLNRAAQIEVRGSARRKAFALVIAAVLLVAIPLLITGRQATRDAYTELQTQRAAQEWAGGSEYRVRQVRAVGDSVYIIAVGSGDPPPFEELVAVVEESVGRSLTIDLELLPSRILSSLRPVSYTHLDVYKRQPLFTLAILTGVFMLVAGLLKLGSLVRFVPNAVMTGFVNAVAILIILGQLDDLTGYSSTGANRIARTWDLLRNLDQVHLPTLMVGLLTIILILTLEKTSLKSLGMIVALVVASLVVPLLGADAVELVRDVAYIPGSLPRPMLPSLAAIPGLLIPALALTFVGLMQGAGITQSIPNPDGRYPDASGDFVGQGVANIVSGLFQGTTVAGSLSALSLIHI